MVWVFLFPTQQQDLHRRKNEVNVKPRVVHYSHFKDTQHSDPDIQFFTLPYQALKVNIPNLIPENQILA